MNHKYPDHFYEPIRIQIAVSQLQHDIRKLLPSLSPDQWKAVDKNISEWFTGEKFELEEAHDFWNLFNGFARGLKLKSLVSWITAENVNWTLEDIPVSKIEITWDFPGLEFMGKAPYSASEVIERINQSDHIQDKKKLGEESKMRSKKFPQRDQFPIIVFHEQKGGVIGERTGYYLLEGNRRTIRAIANDFTRIKAYVGRFKNSDVWPEEYWFPTGVLRDLIFLSIYFNKKKDEKAFDIVRTFYQLLLWNFEIARIATIDKSFKNFERDEKLLLDLFLEDMR